MLDAIVVGAGPAGNQTALKLAEAGHKVAVIDYRARPGDKLCTGIVGRQCFEEYSVPASMVLHEARSATFFAKDTEPVLVQRERPQAYVIDRVAFVSRIAERAATAGARYITDSVVNSVEVDAECVRVTFRSNLAGSKPITLNSRAAVIACGVGSRMAEMAGLSSSVKLAHSSQTVVEVPSGADVSVILPGLLPSGHFGWLVPQGNGKALLGVLGRPRTNDAAHAALQMAQASGLAGAHIADWQHWPIPVGSAPVTSNHRALLVGDAAGQVKPTTGGGIYYSLIAADIAATNLSDALRSDNLSASALRSYDQAWKDALGAELRIGRFARSIFERLDGATVARLLRASETSGLLNEEGSFDWHSKLITSWMGNRMFDAALAPFRAVGGMLSAIV